MIQMIRDLIALVRLPLSFAVTLSALFAYILAGGVISFELWVLGAAIFCLAAGATALNQYQERERDAKMDRTRNRPIPSGRITPFNALLISELLIAVGFGMIYLVLGWIGVFCFIYTLIWYNLFYTPLKTKTPYAAVFGAFLGTVPPILGWLAAGGEWTDLRLWYLGLFYFVWQIPHFWLLLLRHHEDYEKAGFATFTTKVGTAVMERITFIWILLTLCAGGAFVMFFLPLQMPTLMVLSVLFAGTLIMSARLLPLHKYMPAFAIINAFITLTVLSVVVDRAI